jgi:hypothetical protein
MKSKDQILLEDAYQKVLKEVVNTNEELPDSDMKMSAGNLDKLDKSNLYTQQDDREEENDSNEAVLNPSVMFGYQNFLTEEGDNLDVIAKKLLDKFIDRAFKNPNVLEYYSKKYSLSPYENLDNEFELIQKLLVDLLKNTSFIKMDSTALDKIAWDMHGSFFED